MSFTQPPISSSPKIPLRTSIRFLSLLCTPHLLSSLDLLQLILLFSVYLTKELSLSLPPLLAVPMILLKSKSVLTPSNPDPHDLSEFGSCLGQFSGSFLSVGLSNRSDSLLLGVLLSKSEVGPLFLSPSSSTCPASTVSFPCPPGTLPRCLSLPSLSSASVCCVSRSPQPLLRSQPSHKPWPLLQIVKLKFLAWC